MKLINLSNHPSSTWQEKQIAAATAFGDIVDYPFPKVDPTINSNEVHKLAESTLGEIIRLYGNDILTIHIMGEFTLTFSLINLFKSKGIKCIASTTERVVTVR